MKDYFVTFSNTIVKGRISATVNEKTVKVIDAILKKGNYRNKSHVIESAIELLEEKENGK